MASEMSFYGGQGINLKPERFLFNLPNSIMSFRSMVSFAWPTLYLRFRRLVQSLSRFSACRTKHLKLATLSHSALASDYLSTLSLQYSGNMNLWIAMATFSPIHIHLK